MPLAADCTNSACISKTNGW
ncbi:hypothetical protein YPPY09_4650, partial [Yersinia pestis PY-09]